MDFFEKQISTQTVYRGHIVNVRRDVAEVITGSRVPREVVEHPGGVAVVPVGPDGLVHMVRQFRYPMGEELLEIPAGKLEYGEDPYACAVRELSEETGFTAGRIVCLGPIYPSPGFSAEILHLYLALDLTPGEMHLDENEFLSVEPAPLGVLIDRIMAGEIRDAKTIIGLFKTKRYLEQIG